MSHEEAVGERGTVDADVDVKGHATTTTSLSTKKATMLVQPTMSGSYNERSSFQRRMNEVARPHLCRSIADLTKRTIIAEGNKSTTSIFVADFGCSEGKNAVEQMTHAADAAFSAAAAEVEGGAHNGKELSLTVAHCDLTNNGWGAVAAAISSAGERYVGERTNGRVVAVMHASDLGFYQRCFLDSSVDLVHGAVTYHWASRDDPENSLCTRLEGEGDDAFCLLPGLSSSSETLRRATNAAHRDWERIVRNRAAELKKGGLFVAALICQKPEDTICLVWRMLSSCVRDLVAEGKVTEEEARAMVIPVHLRSPEDHSGVFKSNKELGELFRVVVDENELVESPEHESFSMRMKDNGDEAAAAKERYGKDVASFVEAVSRTMVEGAIFSRLGSEKASAVANELYFERFAKKIAQETPPFDIVLQTLVLERI